MPTVPCGPTEHVPREANGMANVMAAVHKLLSRKEAEGSEEAQQAIKKEAEGIRARGVWDDSSVREMHELIRDSKASGREVHLADLLVVSSIKNAEMGPGHQKHKARIVFRGDAVRDVGSGALAFFKELHSLPSNLQSVHATIWYGLLAGHTCQASDAYQAYLQANLATEAETWIHLPRPLRLPGWSAVKKPVVRLDKALYGHPQAAAFKG